MNGFSKHVILSGIVALMLISQSCKKTEVCPEEETTNSSQKRVAVSYSNLALRWAPIHYQDVDVTGSHGLNGRADYITAINFDGDWIATNNWNNISPNKAYASTGYYSVVETSTHWFIVYAFFHPRDWTDNVFGYGTDEHENDLEGCLSIIKKDESDYGMLQAIVTVAHSDFYSYIPGGSSFQSNYEDIDGSLTMESYQGLLHPVTAQEAKGHGLKAYPYYKINGGDGLKYFPTDGVGEFPSNANDRDVKYSLTDILSAGGLWDQRNNTQLFVSSQGAFKKSYGSGGANAPWNWDDSNDGPVYAGYLATDPIVVTQRYFKNLGNFSTVYIRNVYKGI